MRYCTASGDEVVTTMADVDVAAVVAGTTSGLDAGAPGCLGGVLVVLLHLAAWVALESAVASLLLDA